MGSSPIGVTHIIDGHQLAHTAAHVVAATMPTPKPRLVGLGHLLERRGAGLAWLRAERRRHRTGAADGFNSDARRSTFSPEIVLTQMSTSSALGPPLRLPVGDG